MEESFDCTLIRKIRREKGIRQIRLAEMVGISNSYLSDIEVGRTNPSLKTLLKIAKALEVNINTFVIEDISDD